MIEHHYLSLQYSITQICQIRKNIVHWTKVKNQFLVSEENIYPLNGLTICIFRISSSVIFLRAVSLSLTLY